MLRQILVLVATIAAAGCSTAEDPAPAPNEPIVNIAHVLPESAVIGRWVLPLSGEVIDLRPGGVFVHTPATVLHAEGGVGTWRLMDFAGSQYLVTVRGGTSAQKTGVRTRTTLELTPGGVYQLTVAQ